MKETLRAILDKEKNVLPAGGKHYFLLHDTGHFYFILQGKADIFASEYADGAVHGARNHIARLETGRVLFGFPRDVFEKAGIGLLVNGAADTRVAKIPLSKLKRLARNPAHAADVAAIIDDWLEGVSKILHGTRKVPRIIRNIQPDQDQAFGSGESAMPSSGTIWFTCKKGACFINGNESLAVNRGSGLVALPYPSRIEFAEDGVIRACSTRDVLRRDGFWPCLENYHGSVVRQIGLYLERDFSREQERIAQRNLEQKGRISRALYSLKNIIDPGERHRSPSAKEDHLLAVCQEVGQSLGIDIQPPVAIEDAVHGGRITTLSSIARASRIRTRRVALKGAWWKSDNGPMIGYLQDDKCPVALLPRSAASYEMFDPRTGERILLTGDNIEPLDYFADILYRTFPAKMMKGLEVLWFGLAGRSGDIFITVLMGLLGGLLGLLTPVITGVIFDEVIPGVQLNQLFMLSMALVVAALATAAFEFTRRRALLRMEGRMDQHVQGAVIDRLIELPMHFYKNYSSGDLAERAMGINAIRQVLSGTAINAIISGVFSLFNLALLFYYSVRLAKWALLITAAVIVIMVITNYFQLKAQKKMADSSGRLSGKVLEFIMGISKFRVAGAENRAFSMWAEMFGGMKHISRRSRSIANTVEAFIAFVPVVSSMIIFYLILDMSGKEPLSIGSFLAFNASFGQFLSSALQILDSLVATLSVIPLYQRSRPILEAIPESDIEKVHPGELTGRLEMNQVSFSYSEDGPLILDSVSLHAEPGEFIALVGPSGSGKSTIIRLLLGFERPDTGGIFYDEQDLAGLDVRAVRLQMGVVLQNGQVMSGDILSNIVGSTLLTVDDAWEAVRMAGLEDDIRQLPMGMYTVISEGGSSFSGGQKQRLMIARAIARRPKILIFDEATSALDNQTQAVVNRSLEELNTTRIVIAHRLSTIVNAKRIYVLDRGRIVQVGSYNELMNSSGVFADIATRQIT